MKNSFLKANGIFAKGKEFDGFKQVRQKHEEKEKWKEKS